VEYLEFFANRDYQVAYRIFSQFFAIFRNFPQFSANRDYQVASGMRRKVYQVNGHSTKLHCPTRNSTTQVAYWDAPQSVSDQWTAASGSPKAHHVLPRSQACIFRIYNTFSCCLPTNSSTYVCIRIPQSSPRPPSIQGMYATRLNVFVARPRTRVPRYSGIYA
jgi:hypothetical protein